MAMKNNPFNFTASPLNQQERVTMGVPVIDTNHAAIHAGVSFTMANKMDILSAGVGGIQMSPPANVAATITLNMTNALADLTYTAVNHGTEGNNITVTHVNPSANNAALSVSVSGTDITINLATNGSGVITSTAALVKAAVNANAEAAALVVCEDEGVGSGVVNAVAHTHLANGSYAAYVHFNYASFTTSAGPVTISLLEDYTYTGSGSVLTPVNRNFISDTVSIVPCSGGTHITAVNGAAAKTKAVAYIPGQSAGTKIGGAAASDKEWILKPGKNYLFAITNGTSPGATITVGYDMLWYEEAGA